MAEDPDAAGVAFAGAAFAARRREKGITQQQLADQKLISPPALIAFEKGRAWPRDKTRAKLEEVVSWPPGTLQKLSTGSKVSAGSTKPSDLLTGAVMMAAGSILAAVDKLPPADDPGFAAEARAVLADLRNLEMLTARAVRSSQGSAEVIRMLREIRHRYDDVMTRAAAAPGATVGQRLYAARTAAAFTVDEAAGAAGVSAEVVTRAESEQVIDRTATKRIEALITQLAGG